jgi:hypothetical protein
MAILEIYLALRDVPTFARFFPAELLPIHPVRSLVRYTLIIISNFHTKPSSH